jgi:dTDP-4-dehydrorhamnose reductase
LKKILITGSTGKLGLHLTESLSKNFKISHVGKKKRKYDLTKINPLTKYLLKINPHFVINCAAITNIEVCEKKKLYSKKINVGIVKNILDIKKKFNLNFKLIHISTDQMYDHFFQSKNTEKIKPKINNNYTRQKLTAEKISLKINSIVLRTNFFGFTKNKKNQSFSDWLYDNAYKGSFFYLFNDIRFNPVRINTLSNVIKFILKNNDKNIKGVFNIGCKNGISKKDFALKFLKKFKKLDYKSVKSEIILKTKRSKNMVMNVKKFEKIFKFKLPRIESEINKEKKFYEKNYNK